MRRPSIIVVGALIALGVVLGATVFRDDIAQAAGMAGSAPVTVTNTSANPVPVSGTVGLGAANTDHLANIDTQTGSIDTQTKKLSFDTGGNLKTTVTQVAPSSNTNTGTCWRRFSVSAGSSDFWSCGSLFNATLLMVGGADDDVRIDFMFGGFQKLSLFGSGLDGNQQWQLPLQAPGIAINGIRVDCQNFIEDCDLFAGAEGTFPSS
jgi:hypothetical protein